MHEVDCNSPFLPFWPGIVGPVPPRYTPAACQPAWRHTLVIVILPAYNEAEALPPLFEGLARLRRKHVPDLRVILVDDGSQDGTADLAPDVGWVRVVRHARNLGLSQAIQTGFRAALDEAAPDDVIVTMDADNTHPPGLIPRMLSLLDEGHDVVIASRFRPGARMVGIPFHRRLFSLGVSAFFRIMQPVPGVRDFSSGYRAYRAGILRRAYSAYGDEFITEQGFACMVEILFQISRLRPVIIGEVPMVLRYDLKPGPTKMNASRTIVETLRLALRHRFRPAHPRDADRSSPP